MNDLFISVWQPSNSNDKAKNDEKTGEASSEEKDERNKLEQHMDMDIETEDDHQVNQAPGAPMGSYSIPNMMPPLPPGSAGHPNMIFFQASPSSPHLQANQPPPVPPHQMPPQNASEVQQHILHQQFLQQFIHHQMRPQGPPPPQQQPPPPQAQQQNVSVEAMQSQLANQQNLLAAHFQQQQQQQHAQHQAQQQQQQQQMNGGPSNQPKQHPMLDGLVMNGAQLQQHVQMGSPLILQQHQLQNLHNLAAMRQQMTANGHQLVTGGGPQQQGPGGGITANGQHFQLQQLQRSILVPNNQIDRKSVV